MLNLSVARLKADSHRSDQLMNTHKLIYKSQRQPIYEEWLNTLPSSVAAAMRAYLPEYADCYRIVGDGDGHYFFLQVNEPFADLPVTCNLLHGRHSSAAGTRVAGVPLAEILICDCGTLQFPYPLFASETMRLNVPFIVRRYFLAKRLLDRHRLMPGSRNSDREYSAGCHCPTDSQAPEARPIYDNSVSNATMNTNHCDQSVRAPRSESLYDNSDRQHLYEEWIRTLPPAVVAALRLYLPAVADCYRIVGDGEGHYFLDQVVDPIGDFPVTCNLLHGKSSSAPGMFVTGVPLSEILPCDCGSLEFPAMRGIDVRTHLNVPSNIWTRHDLTGPLRSRRCVPPSERVEHHK